MLSIEEFRPHFLSFYRILESESDREAREAHFEQFSIFLEKLHQRVYWEAPLLKALDEGRRAGRDYETNLSVLLSRLNEGEVELESVKALHRSLEELYLCQEQLPVFTDAQAFNEILILLSGNLAGLTEAADEPLRARLGHALQWIEEKAHSWNHFFELFPEHSNWSEQVLSVFSALKGGCGGIFSALESGAIVIEGREAGEVLLNALTRLAELEAERYRRERGRFGEGDLALARVSESLALVGSLSEAGEGDFSSYLLTRARTLEGLKLKLAWEEAFASPRLGLAEEQSQELAAIVNRWRSGELGPQEIVERLEEWENQFRLQWEVEVADQIDASQFEEVVWTGGVG